MRVEDWRTMPASLIAPLYEAERARWRLALDWDVQATLESVEEARVAGRLPGLVLRGPGQAVVGWTYFVVQDGIVQIGSLLARSSDGLRLLLDGILKSPDASVAREVMCFAFPEGAACESALTRRRFDVTRYWYLRRALDGSTCRPARTLDAVVRPLHDGDGPDAVRLLARGYAGQAAARCFAPHDRIEEWAHYFAQLMRGAALGRMVPDASLVLPGPGGRPAGLAITTAIGPTTLHLAQLVVDPSRQRQGTGARLLDEAMARGGRHGHRLMTLLVSDDHQVARHLYASRGFLPTGYFLYARRATLRRSFPVVAPADLTATAAS